MTRISPGEQFERALRERRTRIEVAGQTWVVVPAGTVLMPRLATDAMVAATKHKLGPCDQDYYEVYSAMVGARPTIPV